MKTKYFVPSSMSIVALFLNCVIMLLIVTHINLRAFPSIVALCCQLFILAMMLDGLDGAIARLLHAESNFGCFLDTYMDFFSFAVIPAFSLITFIPYIVHPSYNRSKTSCIFQPIKLILYKCITMVNPGWDMILNLIKTP